MQAAFQEFTDSAISKTCNFGHDATEEYVEKIYRYAYKLGCKGVTVYRDASREMQVLSTGATAKKVQEQAANGQTDVAEALGRIAELEAELERTRGMLRSEEHTLNSSHLVISYAVFCLKKKNMITIAATCWN